MMNWIILFGLLIICGLIVVFVYVGYIGEFVGYVYWIGVVVIVGVVVVVVVVVWMGWKLKDVFEGEVDVFIVGDEILEEVIL